MLKTFEDISKAYRKTRQTKEIDAGELGSLLIYEPAAVDFEPVELKRFQILQSCVDEGGKPDYRQLDAKQRAEFWEVCADIICMSVVDDDLNLILKPHRDFVMAWPGGMLSDVSSEIIDFIRGEKGGDQENENPTKM